MLFLWLTAFGLVAQRNTESFRGILASKSKAKNKSAQLDDQRGQSFQWKLIARVTAEIQALNCNGRIIIPTGCCKGMLTTMGILCCCCCCCPQAQQGRKVAIDGWGHLMEAITLNDCYVGMGCIALLFDI